MSSEIGMETVDITPDTSLLPKIGKTGYSVSQSISEFVDNSIDAKLEDAVLHVDVSIFPNEILIEDDAVGMDKNELIDSLKLAKSNKRNMLGKFGLGLKTAATSLGEHFEVITSKEGERFIYKAVYDKEVWSSKNKWEINIYTIKKRDVERHGTIIKIDKLIINAARRIAPLRMELGQRFAPYINSKHVQIKVNKKLCKARIPDIIEKTRRNYTLRLKHGTISGWYGLLVKGSQKSLYGFNTFRYGRMITIYDKIGFSPHPTVARLIGELHMNHVPVTHNKKEWIKESIEYQDVMEALREELQDILRLARQRSSDEKVDKHVRERLEIWKDGIYTALRADELKIYQRPETMEGIGTTEKTLEKAEVEIEKRASPQNPSSPYKEPKSTKERKPKVTQKVKRNIIVIKGRQFKYEHYFSPLGEDAGWKDYKINENTRLVQIYTNTEFPAIHTTNDRAFYAFIHIVESISEIIFSMSKESFDKYDEIKDIILRKSAEYVADLKKV